MTAALPSGFTGLHYPSDGGLWSCRKALQSSGRQLWGFHPCCCFPLGAKLGVTMGGRHRCAALTVFTLLAMLCERCGAGTAATIQSTHAENDRKIAKEQLGASAAGVRGCPAGSGYFVPFLTERNLLTSLTHTVQAGKCC